jgi:hypothetical protein
MVDEALRARMNEWAQKHNIELDRPACGSQDWQTGDLITVSASNTTGDMTDNNFRMV